MSPDAPNGRVVLSLFPGIGLLDMAFEQEGFCVVRGPDVLWGGDIRRFNPPAGRFDGVIGGPPCQAFSALRHLLKASGRTTRAKDRIPQFVRCVESAEPRWWLMENVRDATSPRPKGYEVRSVDVTDWKAGGNTRRRRRFWFGSRCGTALSIQDGCRNSLLPPERAITRNARIPDERHFAKARRRGHGGVLPGDGRFMSVPDICELQGLPRGYFDHSPFRVADIRLMLANGVPVAMGLAVAKAVKKAVSDG